MVPMSEIHTLNRIAGERISIVEDVEGVTDRIWRNSWAVKSKI